MAAVVAEAFIAFSTVPLLKSDRGQLQRFVCAMAFGRLCLIPFNAVDCGKARNRAAADWALRCRCICSVGLDSVGRIQMG